MLNESDAAMFLDRPQSERGVAVATTQDDSDNPLPVNLGRGDEQGIGGGTGVMDLGPSVQSDVARLQKARTHETPGFDR